MTDDNNPKPTKKTSAVPLRKETVRVTLKATPDNGGDSGNVPGAPPAPAPTIPLKAGGTGAPAVPSPAPTVKLQTGAPTTPPAATMPLQTATQSKAPQPAPTVKLDTPGTSTPTGATSQPLPKATVQLDDEKKPFEMDAPIGTYLDVKVADQTGEATIVKKAMMSTVDDILSLVALVAALIVLGLQLSTTNTWANDETQENPGWSKLFE